MWPHLGCRQGYSDGEEGGVLLNEMLANTIFAHLAGTAG